MKNQTFKIMLALIVVFGGLFNIGLLVWQSITNLWGFWFFISLQSCFAWGMLSALLHDIKWLEEKK